MKRDKNQDQKPQRKSFEQPAVVTYDRRELVIERVFTGRNGSENGVLFYDAS